MILFYISNENLFEKNMRKVKTIVVLLFILLLTSCQNTVQINKHKTKSSDNAYILSGEKDEIMRVFLITNKKDSMLLRTPSTDFNLPKDKKIAEYLSSRMLATVTDSATRGVGIAAPQVGILKNLILVQRFDKEGEPIESYYNPKITTYSKLKQPCLEGCLSIPNKMDTTRNRAYSILLEYDLSNGEHKIEMVEDFTAVIFQHEIDHLRGILFLDHLDLEIKAAEDSLKLSQHR